MTVAAAEWTTADRLRPPIKAADTAAAIRLELKCAGDVTFAKLAMPSLRFYLSGESNLTHALYELLCNNCARIVIRDPSPKSKIAPVVLDAATRCARSASSEERKHAALHPAIVRRVPPADGVLLFPAEVLLLRTLGGFDQLRRAGFREQAEIIFLISPFERAERREMLETGVSAKTFRTDCVPVVNLFRHTAEPILLDQKRYEYQVVPDVSRRNAMEVFSIDDVVSADPGTEEVFQFEPFYSFRHGAPRKIGSRASGTPAAAPPAAATTRAPRCLISLVDLSGRPHAPRYARRSPSAPPAPTAICPPACPSATKPAISNWKAPRRSSGSSRWSNPPIRSARRSRSTLCGG